MKNIKFFAVALAATTLFASCQKDGGDVVKPGEPAYAGISIVLKSQGATRATTDGTAQEQEIERVTVFVIDNATSEMNTKTLDGDDFTTDTDNNGYVKANAAIPTSVGNKTVYVVANATSELSSMLSTAAAVKTNALALDETKFINETSGALTSLVMSGASAPTVVSAQTAAAALDAPIKVSLTRNVAKIAVKGNAPTVSGGTVSNLQFALAAKARQSYLIKQTNTALYTVPGTPDAAYFSNFSARTGMTYKNVNAANADANAASTAALFALEHTPERSLEGNTTKIVIRGTFIPKFMVANYGEEATAYTGGAANFYVNKATQLAWSEAAYTAAVADTYTAADFSEMYEDGVSYYQVNIKAGQGGARGVERNNYYSMTINSITGFGDPSETGGTEPGTVVPDDANIAVTLEVTPWTFHEWTEDLQ